MTAERRGFRDKEARMKRGQGRDGMGEEVDMRGGRKGCERRDGENGGGDRMCEAREM